MATLTETLKAFQEQVTILSRGGSNNSTNTRSNKNNKSHCWTHGRTRNPRHVGSNYRNKKDKHKDEAALSNRIGGSEKYCADM